jgi:uncharacterized damage-inducible protein DinB
MDDRATIAALFRHNDRANDIVLEAAAPLSDAQLDRAFDMGRGSLRKTMIHIWAGESVWLQRWQGRVETPWPDENEHASAKTLADRFATLRTGRDQFLANLTPAAMAKAQKYRDSKGSLFNTTLGDMVLQMFVHSTHHRAQAVNMLRHLGVSHPQVDYMMLVRQPAQ